MNMATESLVGAVIDAFGGPSRMARALDHRHVTTIIAWRNAGRIPRWRRPEIIAAAQRLGVELPPAFLAEPAPDAPGAETPAAGDDVPAESSLDARAAAARSVA